MNAGRAAVALLIMFFAVGCAGASAPQAGSGTSASPSPGRSASSNPATEHSPSATSATSAPPRRAMPAESCPARFPATKNGLPPATVSSPDRLVPAQPIRAVALCSYDGTNMSPLAGRPLVEHRVLTGAFDSLTAGLRWEPPGSAGACTLTGGAETDFLLGLTYDNGVLWIHSAKDPNDCTRTTNGAFTASVNDGAQFAAVLAAGHWVAAPPTPDAGPCGGDGRWGQQLVMVPAGATGADICPQTPAAARHVSTQSDIDAVAAVLNSGRTFVSTSSCAQETDPTTKQPVEPEFSSIRFTYPKGPAVVVRLARGCRPSVDNGNLQTMDATAALGVMNAILKK